MNDLELSTAVQESFSGMNMTVPTDQIVRRSRVIRARRRMYGVAGALALVAGIALAVPTLSSYSHRSNAPGHARLASWTVAQQADGDVTVTVRQLQDPTALQSTLRSAGIPASVSVARDPSCQGYPTTGTPAQRRAVMASVFNVIESGYSTVIVIHPSALPTGTGVSINAAFQPRSFDVGVGLVVANPQCTGS